MKNVKDTKNFTTWMFLPFLSVTLFFFLGTVGYTILRVALILHWLP